MGLGGGKSIVKEIQLSEGILAVFTKTAAG